MIEASGVVRASLQDQLGERVRYLRQEAKLTQETLADRTKLSRHYISELESGKRNPSLAVIAKLADGLGVSPPELLDLPAFHLRRK